jgi:hypothetical protein
MSPFFISIYVDHLTWVMIPLMDNLEKALPKRSEPACYDVSLFLLEGAMALCLLRIGACPSSLVVPYSRYSFVCKFISTEFLTRTKEDLRWVSSMQGLEPIWL